jgi:hypothetical protein
MNKMDEKKKTKKHLSNFFKLNAQGKMGLSLGMRQNGNPNHVPLGRKELSCPDKQFISRRRY